MFEKEFSMEIALFILSALIGIVSTVKILKNFMRRGPLHHNQHALILSLGFFLTWLCSFVIPLIPSGRIAQDHGIFWFGLAHSAFVGILTYFITRILLAVKSKSK